MSAQEIANIIIRSVRSKNNLEKLKKEKNIIPGIVNIIKGAVPPPEAVQVINKISAENLAKAITIIIKNKVNIQPSLLEIIAKKLKLPRISNQNSKPEGAIGSAFFGSARQGWVFGTPTMPMFKINGKLFPKFNGWYLRRRDSGAPNNFEFHYSFLSNNMNVNFIPVNLNSSGKVKPPPSGYVLTTRNGLTGYFKNTKLEGPEPPPLPPPLPSPAPPPPLLPVVNYSKMTISQLLNARKKTPRNRSVINDAIIKLMNKDLYNIKYKTLTSRIRKLGDILRSLPINYKGRRDLTSLVINDIRNTRSERELNNLRTNLGKIPNENIRRTMEEQLRRFRRRRPGESEYEYRRRILEQGGKSMYELARRRELMRRLSYTGGNFFPRPRPFSSNFFPRPRQFGRNLFPSAPPSGGNFVPRAPPSGGNFVPRPRQFGRNLFPSAPPSGGNFVPSTRPGGLPAVQRNAINNAGGVSKSLETVANVPGGPTEIAKAAEALNEMGGNTTKAISVKGANPIAVNAVKKLGGPAPAIKVLEGLNTISVETLSKKKHKRRKTFRPRLAELNRVIEAVKKKKLMSLVAHNVIKTNLNDEKMKKYYKKVIKANILRTPFSKIVKEAAKKK